MQSEQLMYEVDEAKVSSVSERFFADVHLHSTWSLTDTLSRAIPHICINIFVTMGILHTPYMVIMSMVSMVIMRLMYEVEGAKVSSVSERIGERSLQMCIYTALAVCLIL